MSAHQVQVHALFPTPVGSYCGFPQEQELQQFLIDLVKASQARLNNQDPRLRHYFDAAGQSVLALDDPLLQSLQRWILAAGLDFVYRVQGYQCEELQVTSSWLNWADTGGGQPAHCHENSWISGTYYVCFEAGHAPIRFWRPGAQSQPNRPYLSLMQADHMTIFSADHVNLSPASGTMLLWPSHLVHGHSGNVLDGRLSLSFNLMPKQLSSSSYSIKVAPFSGSD